MASLKQKLSTELIIVGSAFMFLTRLPVGRLCSGELGALSKSTRYFPLVGAVVGAILALFLCWMQKLFPVSLAALLCVLLGVYLTGAFHEDGLADVADSAGAFDVDKKLQIMRDSRVGTYGALALVGLVQLKWIALWELLKADLMFAMSALIAAHTLSRWSSIWLMATVDYARLETANKVVAAGVCRRRLIEATVCVLLIFIPLAWWTTAYVYSLLVFACIVSYLAALCYRRSLGGITGDCLGATNQIVEVLIYLFVLAFTKVITIDPAVPFTYQIGAFTSS